MEGPRPVSTAQGSISGNPGDARSSIGHYEALFRVVRKGDLHGTMKFLEEHPEALNARINHKGQRALHIAAMIGHLHIVKQLVEQISEDDLELATDFGMTALQYAAYSWDENVNIEIAKCMINKNKRLPAIPSSYSRLPVTWALEMDQIQMARYLYSVTPFEALLPENGVHGADLLVLCYHSKMFDIALDLVRRCPTLVMRSRVIGDNFLSILAKTPSPYPQLPFWKRCLYTRTKEINEAKLGDEQSLVLLRAACNAISPENEEEISESGMRKAILMAARRGNATFIVEALKAHLTLLWAMTEDRRRIFSVAVQYRQASVYNLLHGLTLNPIFSNSSDAHGNYMLHMAGLLAPPEQLSPIPGALLQMQRTAMVQGSGKYHAT